MNTKHTHPNGLLASLAIQSTDQDTGTVGDWIFSDQSPREPGCRVSPVFDELYPLYRWLEHNGWVAIGDGVQYRFIYDENRDENLR